METSVGYRAEVYVLYWARHHCSNFIVCVCVFRVSSSMLHKWIVLFGSILLLVKAYFCFVFILPIRIFRCDAVLKAENLQSNTTEKSILSCEKNNRIYIKWVGSEFLLVVHVLGIGYFERIHAFHVTLTFWHSITSDTFRSPQRHVTTGDDDCWLKVKWLWTRGGGRRTLLVVVVMRVVKWSCNEVVYCMQSFIDVIDFLSI